MSYPASNRVQATHTQIKNDKYIIRFSDYSIKPVPTPLNNKITVLNDFTNFLEILKEDSQGFEFRLIGKGKTLSYWLDYESEELYKLEPTKQPQTIQLSFQLLKTELKRLLQF